MQTNIFTPEQDALISSLSKNQKDFREGHEETFRLS